MIKNKIYILILSTFTYSFMFGAAHAIPENSDSIPPRDLAGATDSSTPGLLEEKKEKAAKQEEFNPTATEDMWFMLQGHGVAKNSPDNIKKFSATLANGADPNKRDRQGETPLTALVKQSDFLSPFTEDLKVEMAGALLKYGADRLIPNMYGQLPIHEATRKNEIKLVELLLSQDAEKQVNSLNGASGYSPLMELVSSLIDTDYMSSHENPDELTEKHKKEISERVNARTEKVKKIADILINNGADFSVRNKAGEDVISYGLQIVHSLKNKFYKASLQAFIDHLKNKMIQKQKQLNEALRNTAGIAAFPPGLANIISEYVISEDQTSKNEKFDATSTAKMWNVIDHIMRENVYNPAYLKELESALENGANPNSRHSRGSTPLNQLLGVMGGIYVPEDEKYKILKTLLDHGANPLLKDSLGNLPINGLMSPGYSKHVELLLAQHPEDQVNNLNFLGSSPLDKLINLMSWDSDLDNPERMADLQVIADLLIQNGADLSARNKDGDDPLNQAIKILNLESVPAGRKKLIQAFVEHLKNKIAQIKETIRRSATHAGNVLPTDIVNIVSSYLLPSEEAAPAAAASVELEEEV